MLRIPSQAPAADELPPASSNPQPYVIAGLVVVVAIFGGLGQDDIIGGSSDLFGLTTPAMRPDGIDTIYGGNGDAAGRNDGDATVDAHDEDSDFILGDTLFEIAQ